MSKWRLVGPKVPDRVWSSHALVARGYEERITWKKVGARERVRVRASLRAGGPCLLVIHGTGLRTRQGLAALSAHDFARLRERYGDRILAFEHRALSHHLDRNSAELVAMLAGLVDLSGADLQLDVLGLSRGGLVARMLVEGWQLLGPTIHINKLVFVGTPNEGSPGARWDRSVARQMQAWRRDVRRLALIDEGHTSAPVYEDPFLLEGHAAKSMPSRAWPMLLGSQDQMPGSAWLQRLNGFGGPAPHASRADRCEYFALASVFDFEHGAPNAMVLPDHSRQDIARVAFAHAPNDLVVPTAGVFAPVQGQHASGKFPLHRERVMVLRPSCNATHLGLLQNRTVRERMLEWLGSNDRA